MGTDEVLMPRHHPEDIISTIPGAEDVTEGTLVMIFLVLFLFKLESES